MNKVTNSYILDRVLLGENPNSYICTNTSNNLMCEVGELGDYKDTIRVTISTDDLMLAGIDKIQADDANSTSIVQDCLYESLLVAMILKNVLEKYPELKILGIDKEKVQKAINNSLTTDVKNINPDVMFARYHLDAFARHLKMNYNSNISINVLINGIPVNLQRVINSYVNDRYSFRTVLFASDSDLCTYYDSNGFLLQDVHDYHSLNLSGITSLKNKKDLQ